MATEPTAPFWAGEPSAAWEPYDPARDGAWDLARAAHLHRRGGFGAAMPHLARDVKAGHEDAIRRLLEGEANGPDGRPRAEFDDIDRAMADSARRDPSIARVRLAWIFRLLNSPHPLRERMTLAWHDHYATGARKVDDPLAMLDQVEAVRKLWDAPISELHRAMLDSAAMQVWLDGVNSEKGKPNENLGREFLELFALGEGAYGEADVKTAARALTGYRDGDRSDLRSRPIVYSPRRHDSGEKTFLGETGPWGPPDLVRIASKHLAGARTVARRLFVTFIDDGAPPPPLIDGLAALIRTPDHADVDVARGLRIVLGSRLFHAEATRGRKVKSPVDFAIGLVRASGWYRTTPDPNAIDVYLTRMGQTLLDPPSVAGWPGGEAWLGAPLLIARANFVAEITAAADAEGRLQKNARMQGQETSNAWAGAVAAAFLPGVPRPDFRLGAGRHPTNHVEALRFVASVPEAHLA